MALNQNIRPYYDDDQDAISKNYLKHLFVPSRPVQARELSQIQSLIQEQIKRFGNHIFKDGSFVLGGSSQVELESFEYIMISETPSEDWVGIEIESQDGLKARVVKVIAIENGDPATIIVTYQNSTNSGVKVRAEAEDIFTGTTEVGDDVEINVLATSPVVGSEVSGRTSYFKIDEGVLFTNSYFVQFDSQDIVIDKYESEPSAKVGFNIIEEFITENDDDALLDNAIGSTNFTAPGAHRLKISLVLETRPVDSFTNQNSFIEILRINNGIIQKYTRGPEYSVLGDTLARRTFDESGDYFVRAWSVNIREHLDDGSNNGVYSVGQGGDDTKMAAVLEPGKGFVKGYEIETTNKRVVDIEKARDVAEANNTFQRINLGNFLTVDNAHGFIDFSRYKLVSLYDGLPATPGDDPANNAATKIGTAKVRGLELVSGTAGTVGAQWRLYLFDVRITSGVFADVESVYIADAPAFTAHVADTSAYLEETSENILIFPLPYQTIKTIRDGNDDSDTSYTTRRAYQTASDGSGNITLTAGTNELFAGIDPKDYIVVNNTTGDIFDIVGNAALGGSPTGKTVTFSGLANGTTYDIIATINKTVKTEKIKTLTDNTGAPLVVNPNVDDVDVISLGVADIYRVVSIIEDAGGDAIDITNNYELDNGQRDNYYGIGKLTLKSGFSEPTDPITITFEYFTHGSGDYFSVDSYTGAIDFEDIPNYVSPISGEEFELYRCLDFRPRVENNWDSSDPDEDAFDGSGASRPEPFKPDTDVRMDLQYYLGRIDSLYVDSSGQFGVVKGEPALLPKTPKVPDNSMWLYSFKIPAYTFDIKNVNTRFIDNKRYTMADIGRIDRRVQDLEYYSTLNLLEQDVNNLKVLDDNGNERFKNGFIADSFIDDRLSDARSIESLRALDPEASAMRPLVDPIGVALRIKDAQTHEVGGTDYELTTQLITLPYTETLMIDQPYANKCTPINPFAVFVWDGIVTLTPSSDFWVETRFLPDIVINTGFDTGAFLEDLRTSPAWSSRYNAWERNFLGSSQANEIASSFNFGTDWRSNVSDNLLSEIILEGLSSSSLANSFQRNLAGRRGSVLGGRITVTNGSLQQIENRIVSTDMIPFARSIDVTFTATGMRPETRVYPFLGGVDISEYTRAFGSSTPYNVELITDAAGKLTATFRLPNGVAETFPQDFSGNTGRKFNTGVYLFELMDATTGLQEDANTYAAASFESRGILETRQRTFESTRSATAAAWLYDPVAQSFTIEEGLTGGAFITSMDVFFCEKDPNIPVTLQIREMDNGFPSKTIIPFGSVTLDSADVNVSEDSSVATRFTFPDPVYLQENVEYCFVLLSNSIEYKIFTAEMGLRDSQGNAIFDFLTGSLIEEQPHTGVFFRSSNNSTWSENQLEDAKFKMWRASFNIGASGEAVLENNALTTTEAELDTLVDERNLLGTQLQTMQTNPIATTDGSTIVRFFAPNHGLRQYDGDTLSSDRVYIKNGDNTLGAINGIPESEINGFHDVFNVTLHSFDISVTTAADRTGRAGGDLIFYTRNVPYETIHPVLDEMIPSGTGILHYVDHYTSRSIGDISGILDHSQVTGVFVEANQNNEFDEHYAVLNSLNEERFASNETSFKLKPNLFSDRENLSPVIDTQRLGVICISNLVDDPQGTEVDYVAETEPQAGSAKAKHPTKAISLVDPAIALKVYVGVNRPDEADYDVYYKTIEVESDELFEDKNWTLMTIEEKNAPTADKTVFKEDVWIADNLTEFNQFKIKVVLRTQNQAHPPIFTDFRLIALGT